MRSEFFEIPRKLRDPSLFSLLVFGGSQGARAINEAMVNALPHLARQQEALRITHQTGEADYDTVRGGYAAAGWTENVEVRKYIDDMVKSFASADLILCRAGATTSAELVAAGKAAIMVPFPLAADDHQRKNAEALQSAGAARMVLQKDLTGEKLAKDILSFVTNPDEISQMETASHGLARRDAATATVNLVEELVSSKR